MKLIDADKFLAYLIFSKHIDSLKCGEVKEAVEKCRVDVLDDIKAEIKFITDTNGVKHIHRDDVFKIIDRHMGEE